MNKNNYCVIMAGGIGSRFWPLSCKRIPKQFIDIMGTGQSLIQMTFNRFKQIIPVENIFVVTNEDYAGLVLEHLPEFKKENILLEPLRKNTAPCIAYANHRIAAINPKASIVVAPSDHLIVKEVEFLRIIDKGLQFVSQDNTLLTLGIKPGRPETGYGYIQTTKGASEKYQKESFHMVKIFTEKPNFEMAKVFCESDDFFWNSGIFFWSLAAIQKEFEAHLPDIQSLFEEGKNIFNTPGEAEFIKNIYSRCANISIDYGLMEKAKNVYVLPADIGWSDLGTWGSMYEHSAKDKSRNVVNHKDQAFLYNVNECIVNIPKDKVVVLQGLKNYIVVDSKDALIVCRKDDEQLIKNYVNDVKMKYGDKYI